jgi:hypothetical protein
MDKKPGVGVYAPQDTKPTDRRKQAQKILLTVGLICGLALASCMVLLTDRTDAGVHGPWFLMGHLFSCERNIQFW